MDKYFFSSDNITKILNYLERFIPVKKTPDATASFKKFVHSNMIDTYKEYSHKKPNNMPVLLFIKKLSEKSIEKSIEIYEMRRNTVREYETKQKMTKPVKSPKTKSLKPISDYDNMMIRDKDINGKRKVVVPKRPTQLVKQKFIDRPSEALPDMLNSSPLINSSFAPLLKGEDGDYVTAHGQWGKQMNFTDRSLPAELNTSKKDSVEQINKAMLELTDKYDIKKPVNGRNGLSGLSGQNTDTNMNYKQNQSNMSNQSNNEPSLFDDYDGLSNMVGNSGFCDLDGNNPTKHINNYEEDNNFSNQFPLSQNTNYDANYNNQSSKNKPPEINFRLDGSDSRNSNTSENKHMNHNINKNMNNMNKHINPDINSNSDYRLNDIDNVDITKKYELLLSDRNKIDEIIKTSQTGKDFNPLVSPNLKNNNLNIKPIDKPNTDQKSIIQQKIITMRQNISSKFGLDFNKIINLSTHDLEEVIKLVKQGHENGKQYMANLPKIPKKVRIDDNMYDENSYIINCSSSDYTEPEHSNDYMITLPKLCNKVSTIKITNLDFPNIAKYYEITSQKNEIQFILPDTEEPHTINIQEGKYLLEPLLYLIQSELDKINDFMQINYYDGYIHITNTNPNSNKFILINDKSSVLNILGFTKNYYANNNKYKSDLLPPRNIYLYIDTISTEPIGTINLNCPSAIVKKLNKPVLNLKELIIKFKNTITQEDDLYDFRNNHNSMKIILYE